MMLPLGEILQKYGLKPKGVVHIGAHWAEEHEDYLRMGIERFVYVEPCKEAFNVMVNKFGPPTDTVHLINCACGAEEKTMPMYVSHNNQGQSNSLLEPNLHLQQHPEVIFNDAEVVRVIPLDQLNFDKTQYDMLVLDVQGYEGEVLKGGTETLKHVNILYTEVNSDFTYQNCMLIDEMDSFLKEYGFERVETYWPSPNWTWGDALYTKK